MTENLTARVQNYAVYLPAVQPGSAERLRAAASKMRPGTWGHRTRREDLDWLQPQNRHWHYKWCLASAGTMLDLRNDSTIITRNRNTLVVGDSGGYQIGSGALAATREWLPHADDPKLIMKKWLESDTRHKIVRWLDTKTNYATTIDMPLWVRLPEWKKSPFNQLTEAQLTALSVDNLRFIDANRDRQTGCKFLNVLQALTLPDDVAESMASEQRWYEAVRDFPFEGWAYGGAVGASGGIYRVLRRLLLTRDDGLLANPRNWFHALGVSTPIWAVFLTAVQRAVRATVNPDFTVSFDSSSPYQIGGKFCRYAEHPLFGEDIKNWTIRVAKFPTGYAEANADTDEFIPSISPIMKNWSIRDLNTHKGKKKGRRIDALADEIVLNHNVYVYARAMIDANDAVFGGKRAVPAQITQAVDIIGELFTCADWQPKLEQYKGFLQKVIGRSAKNSLDKAADKEVR